MVSGIATPSRRQAKVQPRQLIGRSILSPGAEQGHDHHEFGQPPRDLNVRQRVRGDER